MLRPAPPALRRRLRPLRFAAFLQSVGFWVPIEKLFETEIGFDAVAIGFVAAAYAAIVPLLEVPSGLLADRWSRRGVLVIGAVTLSVSALLGGLSHSVAGYLSSALVLGVFFAAYSGTVDAIVYDTVLELTGSGEEFEREFGKVRVLDSMGLVSSALLGGWVAEVLSTRATYFLTIPFGLLAAAEYLSFDEPTLHRNRPSEGWRAQVALGYRALTGSRRLLPVVTMAVLAALLTQVLVEFGPLWLVALAVPAVVYGPYWAGLMSTFGLGGLLACRLPLHRVPWAAGLATVLTGSGAVLAFPVGASAAITAQIVLALAVMVAGIHVTRLLHDAVPSSVRAGVASAVSTLSWLLFIPFALVVGLLSTGGGVAAAGALVAVTATLAGALLVKLAHRGAPGPRQCGFTAAGSE
jgi:MFS family permease